MIIEHSVSLEKLTTFKMGGTAEVLYYPENEDDLIALPCEPDETYKILSNGSNIIINDSHPFPRVVSMKHFDQRIEEIGSGVYYVGASVRIQQLISWVNKDGRGGIEELVSIPMLIGGGICMNASIGGSGVCISDYLTNVRAFHEGDIYEIPKESCGFGFRKSIFQDGTYIILGATFSFPVQSRENCAEILAARKARAKQWQDHSLPNCGSVFSVNVKEIMRAASRLGLHCGGCSFSKKTPNWLLNDNGTFEDVMKLIGRVQRLHRLVGKKCELEIRVWE